MAATDGQIVVAAARWSDEAGYLRELVAKQRLPAVIKITKGQYGGLGVPTLPAPSLQSTALLVSAGRRRKIVAQAVKIKEGRRVVGVGPRIAIPDSYPGYFEILSEEGRSVRGIESVAELARRCPDEGALVREPLRALAARQDEAGAWQAEAGRSLPPGETLHVQAELSLPGRGRLLRCRDSRGDSVLLPMDARARFSALAREDNISGAHTARALLGKRLPLTVRLVHGQPPRGLKSASHFVPELRLLSSFEEEHVFALPLQRDGAAIALPLAAPLKLVRPRNEEALRALPEFGRLVERAARLVAEVADRAHVLDGRLGEPKQPRPGGRAAGFLRRSASSDGPLPLPSPHHQAPHHHHGHGHHAHGHHANGNHHHHHHYQHQHSAPGHLFRDENRLPSGGPYTEEYDEIDQIYDYVRGFAPLPKSVRSPYDSPASLSVSNNNQHNLPLTGVTVTMSGLVDERPEPPPIETIPTKKNQAEKRTRRAVKETPVSSKKEQQAGGGGGGGVGAGGGGSGGGGGLGCLVLGRSLTGPPLGGKGPALAKLYVKNSGTQRQSRALMRQKSASPLKETGPALFKGGSPLFNIRYKSLSNLQQAMELDGTLDSSHSGGRTSGDSGAGAKLPEKRSRRLSRPRSLTNLVWELRNGSCPRPRSPSPTSDPSQQQKLPQLLQQQPVPVQPQPSKCGPRLAVTVVAPRRVGTLYL